MRAATCCLNSCSVPCVVYSWWSPLPVASVWVSGSSSIVWLRWFITLALLMVPLSRLRRFSIGGYDFVEQNPGKGSRWAEMAREGNRILWVMKGGSYLAQVRDGEFRDFKERGWRRVCVFLLIGYLL